jgi:TrpR family trp operon transcriptional repressor
LGEIGQIADTLARLDDSAVIEQLLESLLTPKECRDLVGRWEVVKRLEQGQRQRQIAADLRMSLCKITRGSKELKKPDSVLKKIVRETLDSGAS